MLREGTAAVRVGSEESDDKLMPGNEVANVLALLATHRRMRGAYPSWLCMRRGDLDSGRSRAAG